jgi:hypothetical protein
LKDTELLAVRKTAEASDDTIQRQSRLESSDNHALPGSLVRFSLFSGPRASKCRDGGGVGRPVASASSIQAAIASMTDFGLAIGVSAVGNNARNPTTAIGRR